ncbi:MAG: hypothetical protein JW395_4170 [Nitrospira sp.]|nr:hypothetical protein [Nitrospira sp.]
MTQGLEGWNLELARWRELQEAIPPSPWVKLFFEAQSWNRVPDAPGVYMVTGAPPLLRNNPHGTFEKPLYIGQSTTSMRTRFRSHISSRCQPSLARLRTLYDDAGYPALFFSFLQLPADQVEKVEAILIECYGPPANRKRGISLRVGIPAG